MKRFLARIVVAAAAMGCFVLTEPMAKADVTLDISGNFGQYSWDHGPLDYGSFGGTVTFTSLPAVGQNYAGEVTADVNFYNQANQQGQVLFTVTNSASHGVWGSVTTGGASGYTLLTVAGYGMAGTTAVDVASLDLMFNSNGTLNSNSSIEFTYLPSTYYFAPVASALVSTNLSIQAAHAPEPSTFAVSLVSIAGALTYGWLRRRASVL